MWRKAMIESAVDESKVFWTCKRVLGTSGGSIIG